MSALIMGMAAATALLLVPGPSLARLGARGSGPRWSLARPDAYPWTWRAGWSIACAALVMLLLPELPWLPAVVGIGGFLVAGRLPRPRTHAVEARELPDALDFLAVCLEAGAPAPQAVRIVADVSPPVTARLLREVLAHLEVGRTAEEAWGELAEHPVWGLPVKDLIRSSRSGTRLVTALRLHADDARIAVRDAATKRARTVGVRSVVPLMACFLPAFVLIGVVPIIASLLGSFIGQ